MIKKTVVSTYVTKNFVLSKKSLWHRYWQWLWLVAFIGGLVFVVRDVYTQQVNPLQLAVIHRPLSVLIIGCLLLPWIFKYKNVMFCGFIVPITLFSLWQLISTLWSVNPLWTLYRSLEYLVIVALTAYTAISLKNLADARKWMNWVWAWLGILVASVWIGIIFSPGEALGHLPEAVLPIMLRGVFPRINANSISHIGAILAIIGVCRMFENGNKKWLLLIFWGIVTMILAQGRSGLMGFIISLLLVLVLHRRIGIVVGVFFIIVTLIIAMNFDYVFMEFFRRGQSFQKLSGLSGRLYFWEYAWRNFIINNPIMGFGAFAGGRFLVMPEIIGLSTANSTHSTWIELLVNVGFVGAILFLAVVVKTLQGLFSWIRKSAGDFDQYLAIEALAVLTVLLVRSFFTTAMIDHSQYPFFVSLGVLEILRHQKLYTKRNRYMYSR